MTLKQKILISSRLVAIMAAMAGIMCYTNSAAIKGVYVNKIEEWNKESIELENIKASIIYTQVEALKGIQAPDKRSWKRQQTINENDQVFLAAVKKLQTKITAYGAMGVRQKEVSKELIQQMAKLITTGQALQYPFSGSSKKITENLAALTQIQEEMINTIAAARTDGFAECQTVGGHAINVFKKILTWAIGASFFTFLFALVFGQLIARDLSNAIENLKSRARRLSEGDYSTEDSLNNRSDEFGKLSVSFNYLAEDLQKSKIIESQNEQLESLNNQLKNKNDSLDSFVYRVSHDLKAPVINIQSLLTVIKGEVKNTENEVLKKTLFFMDKTTVKLQQTIYDLLEVSRIERSLGSEKESVLVKKLVEEVLVENAKMIQGSQVTITQDFDQASEVYFSRTNLKSILVNLLTNAVKYQSPDRPSKIAIQTYAIDNSICLSVTDNGLGIDLTKHKEKLFGMFNRFHNHVEGSGVGLYIVKKLIDENGGKVEIESEVDKGTTLKLYFLNKTTKANPLKESAFA